MQILEYDVRFTTPAFLGNAKQSGQWRTPPFKALLRQWWRVVYAARRDFNVNVKDMHREEGLLFGNAWLENDFRKSKVLLRMDRWDPGQLTKGQRTHRDLSYLGYGPLQAEGLAIDAGEYARLRIAAPDGVAADLRAAMALVNAYGTLGGRCRNGWGSLAVQQVGNGDSIDVRPWKKALAIDWPHAIGTDDDGPLVWQTKPKGDWKSAMLGLDKVRKELRMQFPWTSRGSNEPQSRHWLAYPVTKHPVKGWGNNRLPNSLRFKVRPDANEPNRLRAVIFHMPCSPPDRLFKPKQDVLRKVWQKAHQWLDNRDDLGRVVS